MSQLWAAALVYEARKWIGVREEGGDNRGPQVEAFQRAVDGKASGEPWCMAFVQFCLKQVGLDRFVYPSEHCLTVWWKSEKAQRINKPELGCLVFWQHAGQEAAGHVGIVAEVFSDGRFMSIEGNTGAGPGVEREGDGVYLRERSPSGTSVMHVVGFLRPWRDG